MIVGITSLASARITSNFGKQFRWFATAQLVDAAAGRAPVVVLENLPLITTCSYPTALILDAIEVFKTDIASEQQARAVLAALRQHFPSLRATLDLDDCDRVLRVQRPPTSSVGWAQVQAVIHRLGVAIEPLPD